MEHYDPVPIGPPVDIVSDFVDTDDAITAIVICSGCSSEILYNDDSFECDLCSNWLHIACLSISKEVYDAINIMNEANELRGVVGDCLKINCADCQCSPPLPSSGQSGLAPDDSSLLEIPISRETASSTSTHSSINSSSALPQSDNPDFTVVQGAGCTLSNFSPCLLTFNGIDFCSAEHAYQFECAQREGLVQLAGDIKTAPTAAKAKKLSHRIKKSISWNDKISLMWDILVQKAAQSDVFLTDLIASGGSTLLHSTGRRDIIWGTGLEPKKIVKAITDFKGENVFGRLLMNLRSVLLGLKDGFSLSDYKMNDVAVTNRVYNIGVPNLCATNPQGRASSGANVSSARVIRKSVAPTRPANQHNCFHCGVPGHVKRVCRLKHHPVVCDSCKQVGHKKRYCSTVRQTSGYFVLPTVNLCHNNNNSRFSNSISNANFFGSIAPRAAINTVRTFSGFPGIRQSPF